MDRGRASPLTEQFAAQCDRFGRLPVNEYLRAIGINSVFAAAMWAALAIDSVHTSVMSCQHARPMGRFAGYTLARDLVGKPMLLLRVDKYDYVARSRRDAVYTEGCDR